MQSQGIKINTKQTLKRDMSKSIPLEFSTKNRRSNFATVTAAKNKISISNLVIVMFSISIVLYFYMVTSIVLATVDRKATEEKVRQITTELSYIETSYGERVAGVTLSKVHELGYVDLGSSLFTTRFKEEKLTLNN